MLPIDIQRRWRELGRIRMGDKDDRGYPRKIKSWRLTSASRQLLESAAVLYGGDVTEWTDAPDGGMYQLYTTTNELDVVLPPIIDQHGNSSPSCSQSYELWSGKQCKRRCDGTTEVLSDNPCMCDADNRECSIVTRAQVMLPRVPSLGVWRLETKGYYAATELPRTLNLLSLAAQRGTFIDAVLRIEERSVVRTNDKGKPETRRFIVPVIDLPGLTLGQMLQGGAVVGQVLGNGETFGTPPALPREKPSLGAAAELPSDASFEKNTDPDFGTPPEITRTPAGEPVDTGTGEIQEVAGSTPAGVVDAPHGTDGRSGSAQGTGQSTSSRRSKHPPHPADTAPDTTGDPDKVKADALAAYRAALDAHDVIEANIIGKALTDYGTRDIESLEPAQIGRLTGLINRTPLRKVGT